MRFTRPIVTFVAFAVLNLTTACRDSVDEDVPGVRLGMSPRDVRDRFRPGGEGTWKSGVSPTGDDTALDWQGSGTSITGARFEFHLGMLVAVRATLNPAVSGPPSFAATPRTVKVYRRSGDRREFVLLARDCPTHREEAEGLARAWRASSSPP